MTTEFEKYLHQHFSISLEDCKQIAGAFRSETIKKGDYFLRSGAYCNRLSFIQEGLLRIYVNRVDKDVTQWVSTPGTFVTEYSSFFNRKPSIRDIQALTDVQLLTIDHQQYLSLGRSMPIWNEFEKVFIGKCFVFIENRVFDLISLSAEERYKAFFEHAPELFNQVPLQYIASMLGMTPETFSRIRKKQSL